LLQLGVLLLLAQRATAIEPVDDDPEHYTIIPDVKPWAKVKPVDAGYPDNIPAGLPTALPAPEPVLQQGGLTACSTSVRDVLTANKRTAFIGLLSASAEGRAVLDGKMDATVLAPTDAAVSGLGLQLSSPLAQATVANYHVLQGKLTLEDLLEDSGLWLNTTLTKADCPTAAQTLIVMAPGNGSAAR